MITITTNKIKYLSQNSYKKFIEAINLQKLTCSCNLSGQLIKHAYYNRTIKTSDGPVIIIILRVKFKSCGKTHAIFPELIVPYSQISLYDHISIIRLYNSGASFEPLMIKNEYIDESNIRYIIRQYLRHWKERIAAFSLSIQGNIHSFIIKCLKTFSKQFMQIKCTPNILFS